jgi:hypothetical protein
MLSYVVVSVVLKMLPLFNRSIFHLNVWRFSLSRIYLALIEANQESQVYSSDSDMDGSATSIRQIVSQLSSYTGSHKDQVEKWVQNFWSLRFCVNILFQHGLTMIMYVCRYRNILDSILRSPSEEMNESLKVFIEAGNYEPCICPFYSSREFDQWISSI